MGVPKRQLEIGTLKFGGLLAIDGCLAQRQISNFFRRISNCLFGTL